MNFKVVLLIFLLLISGIVLKVVLFPVNTLEKSIDTSYDVVDETMTAENAIYNYEWFIDQEAHIRACLKNEEIAKEEYDLYLNMLPEDRTSWAREDKQEESSLRNSYYALQKLTNLAMEDYNAKSEMVNRNIFKDNLPSNITRAWYAGRKLTK
jgi:cell wall assembly regulator SMI1